MKDRNDEDLKQKLPESWQRLETVAFHFNQLYQRLAQDRDNWAMTGGDLAGAVDSFEKKIQHLETLDERLKQHLNHSMEEKTKQSFDRLISSFRQETQAVLAEEIKDSTSDLFKTVQEAKHTLFHYQQEMANSRKWWIGIAFMSALLGGFIGGLIFHYLLF